jgi:23S rRNA (cytidine1920-2'-O)/16S rRNA (cytidine1409-2'-O)-methyltransferase
VRLDHYLVEKKLAPTRSKAQQLIEAKKVLVDGKTASKASMKIDGQQVVLSDEKIYVSRAAYKLKGFLPELPFSVAGMHALDIGSSTGGFTQVLLEEGAADVTSVDVGSDQLHPSLRSDPRVASFENTDIRTFESERVFDLVTSDVSFISLLHILDAVDHLAKRWIILLFKPQFEVGREARRDRHGVVQDEKAILEATERFEKACEKRGWRLILKRASTLKGKEGNVEQCYCFEKY